MEALGSGRYRDLRLVGEGGMGRVYAAFDAELQRAVALKVVRAGAAATAALRERLRREVLALARVNHPSVVRVLDVSGPDEEPFYVMELLEGESLATRLARGPGQPAWALGVAGAVADALAAIHAAKLLHRDVKPSNVFLCAGGAPKLTDFGLARATDAATPRLTGTGQVVGTLGYLAPELLAGAPDGPRTDVYGLGVTLYETLTGGLPRDGLTVMSLARGLPADPPRPPSTLVPGVAPAVDAVCLRLLEPDPARRFRSAAEARDALAAAARARPPAQAPRQGAHAMRCVPAPAARPGLRVPLALAGLLAALALLWTVRGRPAGPEARVPFEPPLLETSTVVRLAWRSGAHARYRVEVAGRGDTPRAPEATTLGDGAGAPRGGGLVSTTLTLKQPVAEPVEVVVCPVGDQGPLMRLATAFLLDPGEHLERLLPDALRAVDRLPALETPRAADLLRPVQVLRASLDGSRLTTAEARSRLEAHLEVLGLDRGRTLALRRGLPGLLRDAAPSSPLAVRLLPLRALEAIMEPQCADFHPWGSIWRLLGFECVTPPAPRPAPWRLLGEAPGLATRSRPDPRSRVLYPWLVTPSYHLAARLDASSTIQNVAAEAFLKPTEQTPEWESIPATLELTAALEVPVGCAWPPARARLDLWLGGAVRDHYLVVRVGGAPPAVALDVGRGLREFSLSFPVDPARLAPGPNPVHLSLGLLPLPGRVSLPFSVRRLAFWGAW